MSHDYDPSWDYPVIELEDVRDIDEAVKARIREVIQRATEQLAPAMGLDEGFEAFFVEPLGLSSIDRADTTTTVAVYCNGTGSRPVVGFDLTEMQDVCEEEGLCLVQQFELSLAHELGHGYQERAGLGDDHAHGFDEDDAEAFGIAWADHKEIELWRLDPEIDRPALKAKP